MTITNVQGLLSHGDRYGREIAVEIIEHALKELDSFNAVKKLVSIENQKLIVGNFSYPLSEIGNIYVVGAGKGVIRIAEALESILGNRIAEGTIIEKRNQGRKLKKINVIEAGHPIPDEESIAGAKEIVGIAKNAKLGDLVFVCITGGCSALMTLPSVGISLEDEKELTKLLLRSGSAIEEINAVRSHVSEIKGGKLAALIHPAEIINLIVVDEVAGAPWGPTVPDTTSFNDAILVLKKYNLWKNVPESVRKHLSNGKADDETLKDEDFSRIGIKFHNFVLADGRTACEAADRKAAELGLNHLILSAVMEGESSQVGIALAGIALEAEKNGVPAKPPCVLIVGGETTVTISSAYGEGGRNQEFVLAASLKIAKHRGIVIASVGTDGTDGPTDIAGGIVDGLTVERAMEKGIDIFENLRKHNSSYVLRQLKDAIFTGPTGTNVMDLRLLIVASAQLDS